MSNQLLKLRRAFRISQEKLAAESKVKQSTISSIERTRRLPSVHTAIRLTRGLRRLTGKPIQVEDIFPLEEDA
jgi:DNA-binding XRE family transcriptional regulator